MIRPEKGAELRKSYDDMCAIGTKVISLAEAYALMKASGGEKPIKFSMNVGALKFDFVMTASQVGE